MDASCHWCVNKKKLSLMCASLTKSPSDHVVTHIGVYVYKHTKNSFVFVMFLCLVRPYIKSKSTIWVYTYLKYQTTVWQFFFLYRKTAVIYRTTIYDSPILEQKIKDSMNQIVIINCQRTDLWICRLKIVKSTIVQAQQTKAPECSRSSAKRTCVLAN